MFCKVIDYIDLRKYLAVKKNRTGRKRYNSEILIKVILFAFMEKEDTAEQKSFSQKCGKRKV